MKPMTKPHSVLVVDDERHVRDLYVDALRESGHAVDVASDGAEAMRALREGVVPCVVLADVRMPGMDGFELQRAVGRDPQLSSLPVILVTADRILSFTTPARDKPFSVAELDAVVQRACTLHRETTSPQAHDGGLADDG
jgi:CheY-like chemotaxis protein